MGWYPDPTDPDQERYWEGSRWTHNVREPVEPVITARTAEPEPATRPGQPAAAQPGQPPLSLVETHTTDGVLLASFGRRMLARLIDIAAAGLLAGIVGYPFLFRIFDLALAQSRANGGRLTTTISPEIQQQMSTPSTWLSVIFVVCLFVIELTFGGLFGRTPGKFATGIKQVPVGEGLAKKAGWAAAIRRAVVILAAGVIDLSAGFLATFMSCMWMQFSRRRQTIQDTIGRTQVVSTTAPVRPASEPGA